MTAAIFESSVYKYSSDVTPFQKRVYALLAQIPRGKVTTYGALARALQTSPRAVGNALRNNIFAPQIPCHRCVASTGYVNGYVGEIIDRGTFNRCMKTGPLGGQVRQSKARGAKAKMQSDSHRAIKASGSNIRMKLELLRKEGVEFDDRGMLLNRKKALFDGPWEVNLLWQEDSA